MGGFSPALVAAVRAFWAQKKASYRGYGDYKSSPEDLYECRLLMRRFR
jgi:hypothetical protein